MARDMNIGGHELQDMKSTFVEVYNTPYYDVKSRAETPDKDGAVTITWTVTETRMMEVQPVQWSQREARNRVEIEIGGVKYIPTHYGWVNSESLVTATNRITKDSGTTNLLVLRTYEYEDHIEMDLVTTESD